MFTEPRAKAEVLNSQFSSVFNKEETENIPHLGENPIPTIATINITTSGVEKQLSGNWGRIICTCSYNIRRSPRNSLRTTIVLNAGM